MYLPRLGVVDAKRLIWPVPIGMIDKVTMEREDVAHQIKRELLNIPFAAFAFQKLLPSSQQIFNGNDITKTMIKNNPSFSPPPATTHLILSKMIGASKIYH